MCKKCKRECKLTCQEKFLQVGNSCKSSCYAAPGTTNPRYSTKGNNFNLFGHGRSRYGSECGFGQGTRSKYYDDSGNFGYGCANGMGCKVVTSTTVTDPNYRFDNDKFFKPRWCRKNNIEGN